jgi:hypothetical protein
MHGTGFKIVCKRIPEDSNQHSQRRHNLWYRQILFMFLFICYVFLCNQCTLLIRNINTYSSVSKGSNLLERLFVNFCRGHPVVLYDWRTIITLFVCFLLWRLNRQRSEMLAFKLQTPVNHPEHSTQYSEHGESLKYRAKLYFSKTQQYFYYV